MKKIIILGLIGLMGLTSCKKQKNCKHWTMVVEYEQNLLTEANINYIHNPSVENSNEINKIKLNLVHSKRLKQQYCD